MKWINILIMLFIAAPILKAQDMAVEEIMKSEGFSASAYSDVTQQSIGYGTSVERARKYGWEGNTMSKAEAERILRLCIQEEASFLRKKINFDSLPLKARVALLSMSYNTRALIGPKLCKYIKDRNWYSAVMEIAYGHDPKGMLGLIKRRFREARLFRDGFNADTPLINNAERSVQAFKTYKRYYKQKGVIL
jgi:GH24 family phage-related lysozyme (muramidase)